MMTTGCKGKVIHHDAMFNKAAVGIVKFSQKLIQFLVYFFSEVCSRLLTQ